MRRTAAQREKKRNRATRQGRVRLTSDEEGGGLARARDPRVRQRPPVERRCTRGNLGTRPSPPVPVYAGPQSRSLPHFRRGAGTRHFRHGQRRAKCAASSHLGTVEPRVTPKSNEGNHRPCIRDRLRFQRPLRKSRLGRRAQTTD